MSDLFRVDVGAGPPLVLLHGGFLDHTMWQPQLAAFAGRFRVIAPDARGHGRSPNAAAPFRPADDVAALLHELGTGPAVLAGVSMGAATAVDTALEHPGLVRAVLVSGAGTSEPSFTDPWTVALLARWQAAMAAGDLDASVEAFLRFAAGPHRTLADVEDAVVRRLRTAAVATMAKHRPGEADHTVPVADTWARAAGITVPVLAVNGALDSPDHLAMAERLTATVADGRAVRLDGAAHYPNLERADAFNDLLHGFLLDRAESFTPA